MRPGCLVPASIILNEEQVLDEEQAAWVKLHQPELDTGTFTDAGLNTDTKTKYELRAEMATTEVEIRLMAWGKIQNH
jgi:hypothetical protein